MITGSRLQRTEHVSGSSQSYFAYRGIYNKLRSMLVTYHFIKAHFTQLSTAVKAPCGLCLV